MGRTNTNEAKEAREEALMNMLTVEQRREYARIAMPPLDFLKSVYTDPDTPLDIGVAAARAAAPYEHRKLPADINFNDNRNMPLFDMNMLKKLSSEELGAFITMSEKLGIDFGGVGGNKGSGRVLDMTPDKVQLEPALLVSAALVHREIRTTAAKKAPAKKKAKA